MATETRKIESGWFGSESYTYFVAESGNVWLVQADDVDLSDGPRKVVELDERAQAIEESLIDADLWESAADLD